MTTPLCATFANGVSLPTAGEARLLFYDSREREPADGPPYVSVACLGAVAPIPNRYGDDVNMFSLTTALLDAEGRLWQRTRTITVFEFWRALLVNAEFCRFYERPLEDPLLRNAQSATRRLLLEPVPTMCDMREHHLVEVIRERGLAPGVAPDPLRLYQNPETLLFRIGFKYFSARLGLVGQRAAFVIKSTHQVSYNTELLATIEPANGTESIVALNNDDSAMGIQPVGLNELGPLCSHHLPLKTGWTEPAWGLPQPGDLNVWQQAYREAGIEPSTLSAFKPNPAVHVI